MKVRAIITGREKISGKINLLTLGMATALKREISQILVQMDEEIKKNISSGVRSGRLYKRTKKGVMHQASAPGELPKTDRGGLIAGFSFDTIVSTHYVSGELRNAAPHAKSLEFKPAAAGGRPFMRPLFKKWNPIAKVRIENAIKNEVSKSIDGR